MTMNGNMNMHMNMTMKMNMNMNMDMNMSMHKNRNKNKKTNTNQPTNNKNVLGRFTGKRRLKEPLMMQDIHRHRPLCRVQRQPTQPTSVPNTVLYTQPRTAGQEGHIHSSSDAH